MKLGKKVVSVSLSSLADNSIKIAALLTGKNRSEFMRDASTAEAQKIIKEHKKTDPALLREVTAQIGSENK